MLVSEQAKFVFVHIQKTGGMTVRRILEEAVPDAQKPRQPNGRHASLRQILRFHPHLRDYWTFGFVRNPWDRLLSWHSMVLRRAEVAAEGNDQVVRKMRSNELWQIVSTDYPTFESFVLRGLNDPRIPVVRKPQVTYLQTAGRSADFIGRQENFAEDLQAVCRRLSVEAPAAHEVHRNRNPNPVDYRSAYGADMRDRVGELFRRDVEAFDYRF